MGHQAVERLDLPTTATAHADTTTVILYGEYPDQWTGSLPARGYNKDGHPECKQLVAGVVARADGIPIAVDVLDGNTDDTTWSREALLGRAVDPHEHILFVADSKAVTHTTVADLCDGDIRFVSRLPNTFGLEQVTKATAAAADPRAWDMVGRLSSRTDAATYRVWPTTGTIGEQTVRLIVVHSSALEAKATRQLADRQDKEAQQLDRELRRWETRHFACGADTEAAWTAWRESPTVIRAVLGRPRRNDRGG